MVPLRPQNYESSQNFRCFQQLISSVPDAWDSIVDIFHMVPGKGIAPLPLAYETNEILLLQPGIFLKSCKVQELELLNFSQIYQHS